MQAPGAQPEATTMCQSTMCVHDKAVCTSATKMNFPRKRCDTENNKLEPIVIADEASPQQVYNVGQLLLWSIQSKELFLLAAAVATAVHTKRGKQSRYMQNINFEVFHPNACTSHK